MYHYTEKKQYNPYFDKNHAGPRVRHESPSTGAIERPRNREDGS